MKIRTLAAFLAMVAGTVVATLYITGLNRPAPRTRPPPPKGRCTPNCPA